MITPPGSVRQAWINELLLYNDPKSNAVFRKCPNCHRLQSFTPEQAKTHRGLQCNIIPGLGCGGRYVGWTIPPKDKIRLTLNNEIARASDKPIDNKIAEEHYCNSWDDRFRSLVRFKEMYGHMIIGSRFSTNEFPGLGWWVSRQRSAYSKMKNPKAPTMCNPLTPERYKKLKEIGFCFSFRSSVSNRITDRASNYAYAPTDSGNTVCSRASRFNRKRNHSDSDIDNSNSNQSDTENDSTLLHSEMDEDAIATLLDRLRTDCQQDSKVECVCPAANTFLVRVVDYYRIHYKDIQDIQMWEIRDMSSTIPKVIDFMNTIREYVQKQSKKPISNTRAMEHVLICQRFLLMMQDYLRAVVSDLKEVNIVFSKAIEDMRSCV